MKPNHLLTIVWTCWGRKTRLPFMVRRDHKVFGKPCVQFSYMSVVIVDSVVFLPEARATAFGTRPLSRLGLSRVSARKLAPSLILPGRGGLVTSISARAAPFRFVLRRSINRESAIPPSSSLPYLDGSTHDTYWVWSIETCSTCEFKLSFIAYVSGPLCIISEVYRSGVLAGIEAEGSRGE